MTEVKTTHSLPARRRSRRRWALTLLLGIVGIAGAVLRNRRVPSPPERFVGPPVQRLTWHYRDEVATGRSPTGNGVVRAQPRPSGED